MDYSINYDDDRFKKVEQQRANELSNVTNQYNSMINQSDNFYNEQKQALEDYKNAQTDLQNQQRDFELQQVEQQKDKLQRDYEREQEASYSDYKRQTNQYGAKAQQTANLGLNNSGYSETSLTSMYNTYQSRVATARQTMTDAMTNYDNQMTQIRLQNDSKLAEIAYNTLQQQLELSLQGFQYKNQLTTALMDKQFAYNQYYDQQYQNVLSQINTENSLAEQVRQFNEQMAYKKQQDEEAIRQFNEQMAYKKEQDALAQSNWEREFALAQQKTNSSGSSGGTVSSSKSVGSINTTNNSKTTSNEKYSAVKSPLLSNTNANKYFASTFGTSKLTEAEIRTKIEKGITSGKLTAEDGKKILSAYGITNIAESVSNTLANAVKSLTGNKK